MLESTLPWLVKEDLSELVVRDITPLSQVPAYSRNSLQAVPGNYGLIMRT